MEQRFDVIVVGGGHAGCEAAAAAARLGARTALVSFDPAVIGAMSCNPAIGGVGKGHLVREVDACGGLIGLAADEAAIHRRMLNASKGRAVQGPRIQADRRLYAAAIQRRLGAEPDLQVIQGEAAELISSDGRIAGLRLADGRALAAGTVVLATGTFLGGRMFAGARVEEGGRRGEAAANRLAVQLRELAGTMRLKTGTPPRLDGRGIDWGRLELQRSDTLPWRMSPFSPREAYPPALFCAITYTNPAAHDLIRESMDESPLATGAITGSGPRYCPSIEDKVRRFADRERHQIFLEPEGMGDALVYPNGISTSLPAEVQQRFVNAIAGLERCRIVVPGYAVEYDCIDPRQLDRSLQLRALPGLYLCGQVNGTTGYEEAAAQGLVAGAGAAAAALGHEPMRFERADSYIGVMIDDLVLQGVSEPYRMLTARAENRLHLRSDNAEARLGDAALAAGLLSDARSLFHVERQAQRQGSPNDPEIIAELEETERYAPYVARERQAAAALADDKVRLLVDYERIGGLSTEMRERLAAARPATLGEASRIRGITPAALSALLVATRQAQRAA